MERAISHYGITESEFYSHPEKYPLPERGSDLVLQQASQYSTTVNPETKLTDEQLMGDREPIPFTPVKHLQRDDVLYVTQRSIPHPIAGYSKAHKEYSVIDLRGYRRGYEPRLEIQGIYTLNPKDTFRLQDGHLPPYQPTTAGDKLPSEMRSRGIHKAFRLAPIYSPQTEEYITISFKGDTTFKIGEVVSPATFNAENERVKKLRLRPAKGWSKSKGVLTSWGDGERPAESLEEYEPATIDLLAKTEGDPISKFCCRQCGECAPSELLEEGKFPERIAWLRKHYAEKHPGMWGKSPAVIPTEPSPPPSRTISRWRRVRKGEVRPKVKETFGIGRERDKRLEKRRITPSGKPLIEHLAMARETRDIWLWPKTEFSQFEDFINNHLTKWSQLMKTGVPDCLISDGDEDLFYSTTGEIVMPVKMARLYEQKPQGFDNLLFWIAHEFSHYVAEVKGLMFESDWDEEDYANRMAEYVTSIPMPNAIVALHDILVEVWNKEVGISLAEALATVPKDRKPLSEWLSAVIPTEPTPRSRKETELEYLADSPEFLAQTIDATGWRDKLEQTFQEAITRARGE